MFKISCANAAMGVYSYGVVALDARSLGKALTTTELKAAAIVKEILPCLVDLLASSSWAVLWTHSVEVIRLGRYLSLTEGICFGAFSCSYGCKMREEWDDIAGRWKKVFSTDKATPIDKQQLQARLWKWVGTVCFAAWSVLSLSGLLSGVSLDPAILLFLLFFGVLAKVVGVRLEGQEKSKKMECHAAI